MMWETKLNTVLKSAQAPWKVVLLIVTSLLINFLYLIQPAQAQSNFNWQGDEVIYNNLTFSKQTVQDEAGRTFYVHREGNKAHVLLFNGDAKQAKVASYAIYDVKDNHYSNPQNQTTVNLASNNNRNGEVQTSCTIEGIGWIVCPVLKSVAKEMDKMKEIIDKYMTIKRISLDKESTLMRAWTITRNIANILFIITFLIMIISYITSYGVTNYNIKKTLPRLIIGAILVNFSFHLCVAAVDLTNILGGSIADLFRTIQTQTLNSGAQSQISWYEFTTQALAGGAIAVSGALAASFAFGGLPGILLTLFAAIIGAAITLVITVIILAGRQALILTLIIISPLAFVANLFPNTEEYFSKWWQMLKKLLFIFPIFSVVYGGAQLAGWIIIKEANDAIMLLLGMIVQIIPFLILPKLVKDSNSLLSKLGDGFNKTIFDPIRKTKDGYFDRKKAENRARYIAGDTQPWQVSRKLTQFLDKNKRLSEEKTETYKKQASAKYLNVKSSATAGRYANFRTFEQKTAQELENAQLELKIINKNELATMFESIKTAQNINKGLAAYSKDQRDLAKAALMNRIKQSEETMATGAQSMYYNQMIQKDLSIGEYRGKQQKIVHASTGIFDGKEGSEVSVVSKMLAATKKEYQEELSNYKTAMSAYKLTTDQLKDIVEKGAVVEGKDDKGNTYKFSGSEAAVWEAAANKLFPVRIDLLTDFLKETHKIKDKNGNVIKEGKYAKYATQIANLIRDNGLGKMATYLGNVSPELIEQGKVGDDLLQALVINQIVKGRFSPNDFINQDKDATEKITGFIKDFKSMKFDTGGNFNESKYEDIGFGIDELNREKILKGFQRYLGYVKTALDPKEETFRQLKDAQVKKLKELETQLIATIDGEGWSFAPEDIFPEGSKQLERALGKTDQ